MTETDQPIDQPITISPELAQRIQEELGENVYLCYQCVKCTSGCPVAEFFDWQPNQIMRALQLGDEEIALKSETPWLCAACQTCTTRCPQGLDITAIMEFLTREALDREITPPIPAINTFNEAVMREVRIWGRSYEPGLMAEMTLQNPRGLLDDIDLYIQMLRKGKVGFFPDISRPPRNVKPIPDAANSIAYYPGCSLHTTASEFNDSTRAVCEKLGLDLIEPKGWQCCGSSAAHRIDPDEALRLPMVNLSIIEQSGFQEVTMPCAACFSRHKFAQYEIHHDEERKHEADESIGYTYEDTVKVSTLTETILNHVGSDKVAELVQNPLKDLHIVSYYGCLLTRPPEVTGAEHPDNPTDIDQLMSALGAEVHDWSYKTTCCGAAHSLTRPDIVLKLSNELINHARQAGAEVIAVACPLCHLNLDARQIQMDIDEPMPVLFFSQLMALALGLPSKETALHKNIIDPRPLLRSKSLL
jgi:heterodisulfide reductase subunit B